MAISVLGWKAFAQKMFWEKVNEECRSVIDAIDGCEIFSELQWEEKVILSGLKKWKMLSFLPFFPKMF